MSPLKLHGPSVWACFVAAGVALSGVLLPRPSIAQAAPVQVAVAANFAAPAKRIAQDFERQSGHKVTLAFGSTGSLYAQIRNGAPFAVFLAADEHTPARLEREGLAVSGTRLTYATGRLVLWSKKGGRLDEQVLRSGRFDKLALANPRLAPYGAAALQTLRSLGLTEAVAPKTVEGSSIAQVYQFVASGNADLGFVALSQVLGEGQASGGQAREVQVRDGSAWLVPAQLHEPIRQDAVLLKAGAGHAGAQAFLAYLRGDAAQTLIRAAGYER
jgi:molybdate transport system substrate-binding protein